jgi:hypothetical protein
MKQFLFFLSIVVCLPLFGQKSNTEDLIDQIAAQEVPESFEYYWLVPESLEQPRINDSIHKYLYRGFIMEDENFPIQLFYAKQVETVNWKNYSLENAHFVSHPHPNPSPPGGKNIQFVKYTISQNEYDSLVETKKPYTILVRKKWFWKKKNIWKNKKFHNEIKKAWKIDDEKHREDYVYYQFSKPLFSEDGKYAQVSVDKRWRCGGHGFTALYRNDNGIWKKLLEYNPLVTKVITTHARCGEIFISGIE